MSKVDDIRLEQEALKLALFPSDLNTRLKLENEKLKSKITQLEEKLKLKSELLMRRALIKKKMHQAKDTRKDEVQCTWCRKLTPRGKLTHLNTLGNFCEECIQNREDAINEK